MNTTLPRTKIATQATALVAALVVTLATLGGIDRLAAADGAAPLMAQAQSAQRV